MQIEAIKEHKFVIDTVGFLAFNNHFFNTQKTLSGKVIEQIKRCLSNDFLGYKLIVPSIVFVEIFEKQLLNEEQSNEFRSTIFKPLVDNEFVHIHPLDEDILKLYFEFNDDLVKLETHDKIIYASAISHTATLITCDEKIISYNSKVPKVNIIF